MNNDKENDKSVDEADQLNKAMSLDPPQKIFQVEGKTRTLDMPLITPSNTHY